MYNISQVEIAGFWGKYKINAKLNDDVNIFIGRNGSGKTTFINILNAILSVDLDLLGSINFLETTLHLQAPNSVRTVHVKKIDRKLPYDEVEYKIGTRKFIVPILSAEEDFRRYRYHSKFEERVTEVRSAIAGLVNVSWLSVHRELLDADRDNLKRNAIVGKNSIDRKLSDMMKKFTAYQLQLETEAAKLSRDFQRQVLESMLYNERFDKWGLQNIKGDNFDGDKEGLLRAYKDLGFDDTTISKKIESHIQRISDALHSINEAKIKGSNLTIDDVLVVSLYSRSKYIREIATKIENKKTDLFAPMIIYLDLLKSFMKTIDFSQSSDEEGGLLIMQGKQKLQINQLSSGEKQLLILLTEALLQKSQKFIFIADEPELSLHIEWQKQLLSSVKELNPNAQIIVATHSPEIAAKWQGKITLMESIIHG